MLFQLGVKVMSSQQLQELIFQTEKLTNEEQLKLASYLMEKLSQRDKLPPSVKEETPPDPTRKEEYQWLAQHRSEYAGQYVALNGGQLISHGSNGREVLAQARRLGVKHPYIVHIEELNSPAFGGW